MYLWNTPISSVPVINFSYERKLQIMVDPGDSLDVPDYAIDAVNYNLAKKLIPKVGCSTARAKLIITEAERLYNNLLSFDSTSYPIKVKLRRHG